jgi:hypothetical protein
MPSTFKVQDNENHIPTLVGRNYDETEELVVQHLFECRAFDPSDGTYQPPVYCLAETARGAIAQSSPYKIGHDLRNKSEQFSTARQLPFRIRGWGDNEF